MKAISIKQPYASLICEGIKDIENRSWQTHYRGPIYIHASAKPTKLKFKIPNQASIQEIIISTMLNKVEEEDLFSCIIGQVDIVDCVINHKSIWSEKTIYDEDDFDKEDPKPIWNWVLANPVLFDKPIINIKGKLSFWETDYTNCECCEIPFNYSQLNLVNDCWICDGCLTK